jgi:hypothetical protein
MRSDQHRASANFQRTSPSSRFNTAPTPLTRSPWARTASLFWSLAHSWYVHPSLEHNAPPTNARPGRGLGQAHVVHSVLPAQEGGRELVHLQRHLPPRLPRRISPGPDRDDTTYAISYSLGAFWQWGKTTVARKESRHMARGLLRFALCVLHCDEFVYLEGDAAHLRMAEYIHSGLSVRSVSL